MLNLKCLLVKYYQKIKNNLYHVAIDSIHDSTLKRRVTLFFTNMVPDDGVIRSDPKQRLWCGVLISKKIILILQFIFSAAL